MKVLRRAWAAIPLRRRARVVARIVILSLAAIAAYIFSVAMEAHAYAWAIIPATALFALSLTEFVVADIVVDSRFPPETTQFLEQLTARLAATPTHDEVVAALERCKRKFVGCDATAVSAALHLIVQLYSEPENSLHPGLVQLSEYAGDARGRPGRVLHATKGIVGRCVRTKTKVHVNFADEDEYRRRMVEEFGFTQTEADGHTTSGRSYLAFPVPPDGEPVAVMYFFSTEPQVFPLAASDDDLADTAAEIGGLLRAAEILK